jgi:tetratricopeptide (TPR) repeat protein
MTALRLLIVVAAASLAGIPALADSVSDAQAGLDALGRNETEVAIRLLSRALGEGGLSQSDRELAYVKRAEAYALEGRQDEALADAERALALDPNDAEAIDVRNKSQALVRAAPPASSGDESDDLNATVKARLDAVTARNLEAQRRFEAQTAAYEAQRAADEKAYAEQLARHKAEVEALNRDHAAALAAWEAQVAACKGGDLSQCAQ